MRAYFHGSRAILLDHDALSCQADLRFIGENRVSALHPRKWQTVQLSGAPAPAHSAYRISTCTVASLHPLHVPLRMAKAIPGTYRGVVSTRGDFISPYQSASYLDDLALAAAWLHRLTADPAYLADAETYYEQHASVRAPPEPLGSRQRGLIGVQ